MVLAISLIKSVPDQEKAVYHALKEMGEIRNIYHIFGNHDFFLILEAESMDSLKRLLNQIVEQNSIDAVKTMLVGQTIWIDMNTLPKKNPARSVV
jgi:DNA-binding Lrp family transcriptional regulator